MSPLGSLEPEPSSLTFADEFPVHSTTWSGPAFATGGAATIFVTTMVVTRVPSVTVTSMDSGSLSYTRSLSVARPWASVLTTAPPDASTPAVAERVRARSACGAPLESVAIARRDASP